MLVLLAQSLKLGNNFCNGLSEECKENYLNLEIKAFFKIASSRIIYLIRFET